MLRASRHPHADWYLTIVSVAEASVFPVPPDVMLAPMVLARPKHWFLLAGLTTAASVVGGAAGFAIGYFAIDFALPLIERMGYMDGYRTAVDWFARYGFWAVIIAGFTPIPYKVFTISAGAAAMAFAPFMLASVLGRGGRFFLVAAVVRAVGPRIEPFVLRHIDLLGWTFLLLLAGGFLWFKA